MRYDKEYFDCIVVYDKRGIIRKEDIREISINNLKYNIFELIEDEVDIDNIKEITQDCFDDWTEAKKINELVQAVKQLNKEIKSIKESK